MIKRSPRFDFFAVGEAMVDLISDEDSDSLENVCRFKRFAGGQVSNLAIAMANLGLKSAAAVCVGDDGFGHYFQKQFSKFDVISEFVQISLDAPTTIAVVSRRASTPDFIIYRGADANLSPTPNLLEAVADSKVVHTSAFALARSPIRDTVFRSLRIADEGGAIITFDPNYHPQVWPDIDNYKEIVRKALGFADITKPSLDDCVRLIGPGLSPMAYVEQFLTWGPKIVALTMGANGVLLATSDGHRYQVPGNRIPVVDTTGAGDAFWAGFLSVWLESENNSSLLDAACFGQVFAEMKVGRLGPVQHINDWALFRHRAEVLKQSVSIPQ